MNRTTHTILCMLIAGCVCLASGCQNNLRIRVERVIGVSSTRLDPDSRLGRRVDAAIRDLKTFVRRMDAADKSITGFIREFPPERQEIVELVLDDLQADIRRFKETAVNNLADCHACYVRPDIALAAPDVRLLLRKVDAFFDEVVPILASARESAAETNSLRRLADREGIGDIAGFEEALDGALGGAMRAATAERPSTGFGGFISTDVYTISPSDPAMREVLGSWSPWKPLVWGLFKRGVSVETLTDVKVGVSGDSSIMAVMEHPGQVRVYQVSMDPTQITRNVAMIVSKATAAAARFASGGVMP